MFITRVTFLFALLCCEVLCGSIQKSGDDFDSAAVGGSPAGWAAAQTGTGDGSVWEIQVDESSPVGKHVLAQTSSTAPSPMFNLCVKTESDALDVDLQVSLKAVSGKTDQGGGPVWRYQDANNYYIARFNPLENNFRVYKVVDGKRTQLATAKVDEGNETWHSIQIVHRGEQIRCSLDGKLLLDVKDNAIPKSGKIGLWTKADAMTAFTEPILAKPSATDVPTQVLVVNTKDASVSLVDLTTTKEVSRHSVGPRPYGIAVTQDGKTVAVGVEDEGNGSNYRLQRAARCKVRPTQEASFRHLQKNYWNRYH